ncbi:MAG: signal protein PDZ, partial [Betaproteobacteria bacterium]|nr:signal protein PDZ [Betaproteobacteria bacterium]
RVQDLASFYRCVWALGQAGVVVPLQIARGAELLSMNLRSINRSDRLMKPLSH